MAGVTVLRSVRRRVEEGARMKLVTAWKFADDPAGTSGTGEVEGLREIMEEDWGNESEMGHALGAIPPKLCFVGRTEEVNGIAHADGCAHGVSWENG